MDISTRFAATVVLLLGSAAAWASPAVTLTDANDADHPITYSAGPYLVRSADLGCDFFGGQPACDNTQLTVNVSAAVAATQRAVVRIDWAEPVEADFDLYVTQGANAIATSASTTDPEIVNFEPINGVYNIFVDSYQPFGNTVTTKIYLEPLPASTPANTGPAARFQVYPPRGLTVSSGEPSVGVNWKTDVAVVGNSKQAVFVTWNDNTSPAGDTWVNRAPQTNLQSFDPILFTDRELGHTVVSQLVSDVVLFTTGCSLSSVTDDDGATWIPAEGCGPPSGADHQTVGGGPHHAPMVDLPGPLYAHAVYYCAQSVGGVLGDAFCSRSDDGGLTYGPGVKVYTSECGGLHGHPRVSPDGTVYLPNKGCGGLTGLSQGVIVSTDNGLTWTVRTVPGSTPGESDPSVATGLNNNGLPNGQTRNTVYLGYCDGDGKAKVAVSHDQGVNWGNVVDVGASAGIKNCVFPEMIAGDDNRASFFFLGTSTGGAFQAESFTGEWHGYVATTYDGGATWGLFDATPNDPVQMGPICMMGIACTGGSRNLLDFNDISLDKEGRPVFVFADGCVAPCISGSPASASRSKVDTLGRQSGGKTLFSQYDSTLGARIKPAAPKLLTIASAVSGVTVKWAVPDDGGSAITGYRIYRSTAAGQESALVTIAANKPEFVDAAAFAGQTYFYQVSAVNANGEGGKYGELSVAGQVPPNNPPVAALSADATSVTAGAPVTFTVGAHDPDSGDTVNYNLDFGDGAHAAGTADGTVAHAYAVGHWSATLTVTDSRGGSTTAPSVAITANPPPDSDGDGVPDPSDHCPGTAGGTAVDANGCPVVADADGDGVLDSSDNCPVVANPGQADVDGDGLGDACDTTDDRDFTPDAFTFVPRTGVATNVFITSEAKTVTGITAAIAVSIVNGQYSVDGGAFTSAAGSINAGQALRVRHVSAATESTTTTTTVTVGTYSTDFTSTTSAFDRTPDAFTFGTKTAVDPGVFVESDAATPTGYNTGISIMAGPGIAYRIDAGTYTSANGTLQPGQSLQVRHTSSTTSGGYTKTYLKVGGVTGYFTTRTK